MIAIPFRARQWIVSVVGSLLFAPLYLFWGGLFSFSFTIYDSICAWAFGLTACWCQLLAMLVSFFNPRRAAYWMVLNTAVSMGLAAYHVAGYAHGKITASSPLELWLLTGNSLVKAGLIFFAPPLLFAFLLLRRSHAPDGLMESSAD